MDFSLDSLELFEILFRQYYSKLYQIAYSITRDKELSKDAVQQAFLQAYRKWNQLKDKAKFSAWVTTITVNEAKNLVKSSSRFKGIPITDNIKTFLVEESFEHAYSIKDQVERVLNVLSAHDSEILVLKYYLDLTLEEIASILKLTVPNVKIRLYRARGNFKEVMSIQESTDDVLKRGGPMRLSDEQLDRLIKERITSELEQIPVPSIDEEWLKFKNIVLTEKKKRWIMPKTLVAALAVFILTISSVTLFKPVQAYAFGERFLQMLSHIVGETTQNKTETINSNPTVTKTPTVNNLGALVEEEITLEEAQKNVYFKIAEPKYLPHGTKTKKISISNLSSDVKRITMDYDVQGQLLILTQQNTISTISQGSLYDTDDAVNKDIMINGTPATLLQQKNGINVLTWYQRGLLLRLTGQLSTDEFLRIAESIS